MIFLSGDAGGELIVSELNYSSVNRSIESIEQLFRKRAHSGQIVKIELFSHDDVFVTASQDGSIM